MIASGPHTPEVEVKGPYALEDGPYPHAWFYREKGRINLHLQAVGKQGVMHYIVNVRLTRNAKQKKGKAP